MGKLMTCSENCTCHEVLANHNEEYVKYYLENKKKSLTETQELVNMSVFIVSDFIRIINDCIDKIGGVGIFLRSHVIHVTNNVKMVSENIIERNKPLDDETKKFLEFTLNIKSILAKNENTDKHPIEIIDDYLNLFLNYSKSVE